MEEQNNKPEEKKEFALVTFIKRVLKLGDEARVESFMDRQVRNLERDIKIAKQNISILKSQLENLEQDRKDKVEDANARVLNAYSNIDVDRLKSNEDQELYANEYWDNISDAEDSLESVEKDFENRKKEIEKSIEEYNEHITSRQNRIDKIKNF
jgi:prefoldin subunit 5